MDCTITKVVSRSSSCRANSNLVGISGYLDGKFFEVCSRVNMVLGALNFDFGDTYNFVDLLERWEKLGDETAVW
jgi:hypothetical protein